MGEVNKDDEADMADRVLMAADASGMWAHIAVEAQSNPTYAIAYAILMLADKVENLTVSLAHNALEIATAIRDLTDALPNDADKD